MSPFRFVLLSVFAGICSVRAEYLPPFDMDTCVGEATTILHGNLTPQGDLEVTEVISGQPRPVQKLKLSLGSYEAERFQKLAGGDGPHEVVAFLTSQHGEEWEIVMHYAGICT